MDVNDVDLDDVFLAMPWPEPPTPGLVRVWPEPRRPVAPADPDELRALADRFDGLADASAAALRREADWLATFETNAARNDREALT